MFDGRGQMFLNSVLCDVDSPVDSLPVSLHFIMFFGLFFTLTKHSLPAQCLEYERVGVCHLNPELTLPCLEKRGYHIRVWSEQVDFEIYPAV